MTLLNELTTIVLSDGTTITTDNPEVEDKIGTAILSVAAVAVVAVGAGVAAAAYKKILGSQEEMPGAAEKKSS